MILTPKQIARLAHRNVTTITRWIHKGLLKAHRVGWEWEIAKEDWEACVKNWRKDRKKED